MKKTESILIAPSELKTALDHENILIVSLCDPKRHSQVHIPGAQFFDRNLLKMHTSPHQGKLPDEQLIIDRLSRLNLKSNTTVIAYDDTQGTWATRFLWTLEIAGFQSYKLLNGGLQNWRQHRYPVTSDFITENNNRIYQNSLSFDYTARVTLGELISRLENTSISLWDARSEDEFTGKICRSQHGGHIPNAINLEWSQLLDENDSYTIKHNAKDILLAHDIKPNKEIITYCHSHLRSSVTWFIGKWLGYNIKAYDGAWSEWGNLNNTPISKA